MASINIEIHEWEKLGIIEAIRQTKDRTVAVSEIAKLAKYNPNRTRFIIEDLLEEKRIERVVTRKFNAKFVRYSYKVVKPPQAVWIDESTELTPEMVMRLQSGKITGAVKVDDIKAYPQPQYIDEEETNNGSNQTKEGTKDTIGD